MTASGARCQADGGVAHACVCTSSAAAECEIPKMCVRICVPSGCAPAFEARSATTCGDGAPNSREDGPSWRDGGGGGARGSMSRKPRGDAAAPATMARPRRGGASEPVSDPGGDADADSKARRASAERNCAPTSRPFAVRGGGVGVGALAWAKGESGESGRGRALSGVASMRASRTVVGTPRPEWRSRRPGPGGPASEPASDPAEDGGAEGGGAPSGVAAAMRARRRLASTKASRFAAEMEISDSPTDGFGPPARRSSAETCWVRPGVPWKLASDVVGATGKSKGNEGSNAREAFAASASSSPHNGNEETEAVGDGGAG